MHENKQQHFINCSAPICSCDTNPDYKDEVVWCPGETICRFKPYQKFQEQQVKINELFRLSKFEDGTFSANHLERIRFPKPKKKTPK